MVLLSEDIVIRYRNIEINSVASIVEILTTQQAVCDDRLPRLLIISETSRTLPVSAGITFLVESGSCSLSCEMFLQEHQRQDARYFSRVILQYCCTVIHD
ncbi:unnamed protein product [Amoebophrya sp. A120]|nr:unnamed protein product [Amoebophrya sp. A120]|eukprot:GSA120T00006025001.1